MTDYFDIFDEIQIEFRVLLFPPTKNADRIGLSSSLTGPSTGKFQSPPPLKILGSEQVSPVLRDHTGVIIM